MVSFTPGLDMENSLIFIPQPISEGKYYTGAFHKPPHWKRQRFLQIDRNDNIICIVSGDKLAPQDFEAFQFFESYYNNGSSTISYNDNKLILVTEGSRLSKNINKDDIHSLIVDCYKAINFRRCDYSDKLYDIYFEDSFTISRKSGTNENLQPEIFFDREIAPDTFVRPK